MTGKWCPSSAFPESMEGRVARILKYQHVPPGLPAYNKFIGQIALDGAVAEVLIGKGRNIMAEQVLKCRQGGKPTS